MELTLAWRCLCLALVAAALAGCSSFASVNSCLRDPSPEAQCAPSRSASITKPVRATLSVDGSRGNPRVLMILALSGGGSRSASMGTEAMIALENLDDLDLLAEVDVLSAVSGGTLPAAFYAVTRETSLRLDALTAHALKAAMAADKFGAPVSLSIQSVDVGPVTPTQHRLRCSAPLDREALGWLMRRRSSMLDTLATSEVWRIRDFCEQATLVKLREWQAEDARERMSRNYIGRMLGNLLWPTTFLRHWFTAYDRADVMAQTLADNLFDQPVVGKDHRFSDLNPTRPFLVINTTAASDRAPEEHAVNDDHAFGSAFAFTVEEFQDRVWSDLADYPIGHAVMASSAFPLAFPHVTLENFHTLEAQHRCKKVEDERADDEKRIDDDKRIHEGKRVHGDKVIDDAELIDDGKRFLATCSDRRFLHLLDGGNSDNLGLRAVKRMLLDMAVGDRLEDYDSIIVVSIDAFTRPAGAARTDADPRSLLGRLADPNGVTEAVDALLQANRRRLLSEFRYAPFLLDVGRDCEPDERHLPAALCARLARDFGDRDDKSPSQLDAARQRLAERLVFYHVGFSEVKDKHPALHARLNRIPTSFSINDDEKQDIRAAVASVLHSGNPCLQAIGALTRISTIDAAQLSKARDGARAACAPSNGNAPKRAPVSARSPG